MHQGHSQKKFSFNFRLALFLPDLVCPSIRHGLCSHLLPCHRSPCSDLCPAAWKAEGQWATKAACNFSTSRTAGVAGQRSAPPGPTAQNYWTSGGTEWEARKDKSRSLRLAAVSISHHGDESGTGFPFSWESERQMTMRKDGLWDWRCGEDTGQHRVVRSEANLKSFSLNRERCFSVQDCWHMGHQILSVCFLLLFLFFFKSRNLHFQMWNILILYLLLKQNLFLN